MEAFCFLESHKKELNTAICVRDYSVDEISRCVVSLKCSNEIPSIETYGVDCTI